MNIDLYKSEIANKVNSDPENVFLYWKGRIALYAILKAMGVKEGDEVILPGFTCVVVPNAIIYLGAKPVYIDISPDNYNMEISELENAVTGKTKVIICQNTFGLSSNVDKIVEIAKSHNLFTIEDCTHGFGGFYKGKPNGSYCDAAFYSTQWNKPFSTGIGGFLVVNNPDLLDKIKLLEKNKIKPHTTEKFVLLFLILFRKYFVNNLTQSVLVKLFRLLSKYNLIIGSNRGEELSAPDLPEQYFKDISSVQIKAGLKRIQKISELNALRRKNALEYTSFLKLKNKTYVDESLFDDHMFLKYPLLVKNRELFFSLAKQYHLILGDWFLSPLHPITDNFDLWGFDESRFPNAVTISRHIVNLPTEIKDNTRVFNFLNEYLEQIM